MGTLAVETKLSGHLRVVAGTLRGYIFPVRYSSVGVQLTRLRALCQGTLTSECVGKNMNATVLQVTCTMQQSSRVFFLFACLKACFRLTLSTRNKKKRTVTRKKHAYRPETSYCVYYSLNMPRNWSEAVPEGNGPGPQQEELGSGQPTLADVYRMIKELFDKSNRKMDELSDEIRRMDQHLAGLEQDARQPRLAMEADGPSDTKTRERTEGAAKAVQAKHGNSCSANRVDPDAMCSTSFSDDSTGLLALSCSRDGALVGNGAAAPKSCLSPLQMRSPTTAGGLLPAGEASTTTRITFHQPRLRFCPTEETNSERTSTQYALYYNSSFWLNRLPAPSWRRVIQTKSRQNLVFNPDGSKGRLRACLF